jgi:hypothetical protein
MKKDMKELLHWILESWSYMDNEHEAYTVRHDISADDLDYLYGDLLEYIYTKYKLED